jgi:hypothetical protein
LVLRNDTTVEAAITDQTPVINRSQLECDWAGAILPRSDWGRPSLSGRDAGEVWRITSLSRYDNPTNAVREHGTDGATRQSRWHEDPPTALLCLSRPVEKLRTFQKYSASLEEIEHRANSFSCCGCVERGAATDANARGTSSTLRQDKFLSEWITCPKLSNGLDTVLSCCGPTFSGIRQCSCCTSPFEWVQSVLAST